MRHYELLIVLRPTLTEEEVKAKVDFVKEVIEKNGGEIASLQDFGMRKLAYEIDKHQRGHYFVFYYKAPPSAIAEIERIVRITEEIIRFLTVKYENKKEINQWESLVAKGNPQKKESEQAKEGANAEG
ncbi:MAG: 30S ribosomal protein S6 [Epsilonproteobacteria bacterium]|nr:30S ribosomal protein S6 [Campylobacterota bacterium]